MSQAIVTAAGRRAAERGMQDTCTVTRRTGEATNPETAAVVGTFSTIYTGKCRVQQQSGVSRPRNVGEAFVFLARLEIQLPMSVTGIAIDDVVTITASLLDGDLVGRVFHVRELAHKTHETARRVQVEEISG